MANELSTLAAGGGLALPAHLAELAPVTAADDLVTTHESLPSVSIKGKQFRLRVEDTEKVLPMGAPLDVVILAADPPSGVAHAYFEGSYEPGSTDPPDCSSADGLFPDAWASARQCDNCTDCPKAVWGSAKSKTTGKDIKACRDVKNILIVPAGAPGGLIFKLQVPTMSLRALSAYGRELKKHKVDKLWVVTRLTFTDDEFPCLDFSFLRFLDAEATQVATSRALSDEVLDLLHVAPSAAPTYAAPAAASPLAAVPDHVAAAQTAAAPETADAGLLDDLWGEAAAPADKAEAPKPAAQTVTEDDDDDEVPTDDFGVVWDPKIHATVKGGGGRINADGHWRARKGVVQTAPTSAAAAVKQPSKPAASKAEEPTPSTSDPAGLDDILADWS